MPHVVALSPSAMLERGKKQGLIFGRVQEIKRIRNKESSQRFRDRTKERQREKDLRLDFLENRVFELESGPCFHSFAYQSNCAVLLLNLSTS